MRAGSMLGIVDATTIETVEGPTFTFEMAGRVYGEGETDTNEWLIHGEPELHLANERVPTRLITCTSVVNRIPDVIDAPPGSVVILIQRQAEKASLCDYYRQCFEELPEACARALMTGQVEFLPADRIRTPVWSKLRSLAVRVLAPAWA